VSEETLRKHENPLKMLKENGIIFALCSQMVGYIHSHHRWPEKQGGFEAQRSLYGCAGNVPISARQHIQTG
jgi:hypothetical protein